MADDAEGAQIGCPRCRAEVPATAVFCPHCGAGLVAGPAPPDLPGYTILRTLGRGGAAVVYLARQESLERQVAVKVLRRDVDDPRLWRDFRREARTIARLSAHPNVVTVYTAGRSAAGHPYLVTEYLDRGSLGQVLATHGPLPPAEVAAVGVAVADALGAAHDLGILHRDVKPGNVMLAHDGRVKLGDFGIARLLAGQSTNTTDRIAFTPEHVAPEVLRNEPEGPWSDVYGLGSTLAAALVGSSVFEQRPDERMEAYLSRKALAPPPSLPASVPAALAGAVTRALDPQPARRPTLGDLRRELAAAAGSLGVVVALPPPTPGTAETITTKATVPVIAAGARRASATTPRRGPVIAAVVVALVAAALAVGVLTRDTPGGKDAAAITSPVEVVATTAAPVEATVVASTTPATPSPTTSLAPTTTTSTTTTSTTAPPTTTPPTVPAPAAVPVQTTTPAPTAPPTTTPPAVDAPPPARPPGQSVLLTAPQADAFVRSYYDAVAEGDYERSWAQLAPEFQSGKARSYEYYVDFWNDNDIEVGNVALVEAGQDQALVNVELRWNGTGRFITDQFTLRPGAGGELLIARQENVG